MDPNVLKAASNYESSQENSRTTNFADSACIHDPVRSIRWGQVGGGSNHPDQVMHLAALRPRGLALRLLILEAACCESG
jgi:hypothetical protein